MPEKTVETWRNLWFHTGDALRRDEDGWYYFIDRYKDALRRRGENISSYEVEQAILGHPAVVECAVIGVPADQEAGEDEVLAVRLLRARRCGRDPPWCEAGSLPSPSRAPARRLGAAKTPSKKVRKAARRGRITLDTYDYTAPAETETEKR